ALGATDPHTRSTNLRKRLPRQSSVLHWNGSGRVASAGRLPGQRCAGSFRTKRLIRRAWPASASPETGSDRRRACLALIGEVCEFVFNEAEFVPYHHRARGRV